MRPSVFIVFSLCWFAALWAGVSNPLGAQKLERLRDTFDQSSQLFVLRYKLSGLGFRKQVFVQTRVWTDSNTTPDIKPRSLAGDTAWVKDNGWKTITWDPFRDGVQDLEDLNLGLEISAEKPAVLPQYWAVAWHGSNSAPFGLKVARLSPVGFFGSFRSSLQEKPVAGNPLLTTQREYPAGYTGPVIDEYPLNGVYEIQDERRLASWAVSGGIVGQVGRKLYVYGGPGYGIEQLYWQYKAYDPDNNPPNGVEGWVVNEDVNHEGIVFDLGAMLRLGRVVLDAGGSTIGFRTFQVIGSIGITLHKK